VGAGAADESGGVVGEEGVDVEPMEPFIAEAIRLELFDPALRLMPNGQVYGNPLVMAALDSTETPTGHLVYDRRGGTLVALLWVKRGSPGAVPVRRRPPEERTGVWRFGPILARYPALKVDRGWVRRFPFRVEDGLFLIDLAENEVVPSKRKRRKA
jgi:hypothetical protein